MSAVVVVFTFFLFVARIMCKYIRYSKIIIIVLNRRISTINNDLGAMFATLLRRRVLQLVRVEGLMHNSHCRSRSDFPHKRTQFYIKPFKVKTWAGPLHLASASDHGDEPVAFLGGYIPVDQRNHLRQILLNAGYKNVLLDSERGGSTINFNS